MITEAVIMAGGRGSRLGMDTPKALVPINGKTLIQRQIRYLYSQGITKIVLALGYEWAKVMDALRLDASIRQKKGVVYSIEKEPLGTGGALRLALEHITSDRFLVCNVDDMVNIDLENMDDFGKCDSGLTNVLAVANFKCPFGVVKYYPDSDLIHEFVEKATMKHAWVSTGFCILNKKDILHLLPRQGSLEQLVYPKIHLKGFKYADFWITINDRKQMQEAEEFFKEMEK